MRSAPWGTPASFLARTRHSDRPEGTHPLTSLAHPAGRIGEMASRQLGHARPSITLDIYPHEFDRARGLDNVRNSIDAAFGSSRI